MIELLLTRSRNEEADSPNIHRGRTGDKLIIIEVNYSLWMAVKTRITKSIVNRARMLKKDERCLRAMDSQAFSIRGDKSYVKGVKSQTM